MRFLHLILISLICSQQIHILSQEPSHLIFGEDELSGIDIYSILEDDDFNIWMTSNSGIIKYDGSQFQFLKSDHLKSLSAFALRKNQDGHLFCINLYGQVLKIENDSIEIYFELPDSLVFPNYVDLRLLKNNEILILSEKDVKVDQNKNFRIVPKEIPIAIKHQQKKRKTHYFPIRERENTGKYHDQSHFSIFQWTQNKFQEQKFQYDHPPKNIGINLVYRSPKNHYLFATRNGGAYAFDSLQRPLYYRKRIFKNYFLSGFLEDFEGNSWYTTLGKGILFIRNPKIISYKSHPLLENESIVKLKYNQKGDLFLGSESGKVFRIQKNGDVDEIFSNGSTSIYLIDFYQSDLISSGDYTVELVDIEKQITQTIYTVPSTKETIRLNDDTYLFATSQGVSIFKMKKGKRFELRSNFRLGRCNAIHYNEEKKFIIAVTAKGLKIIEDSEVKEILYQKKKLISTDVTGNNKNYYLGTTNKGVLIYEGKKYVGKIDIKDGLKSNRVLKVKLHENLLFINTFQGIQIYNIETQSFVHELLNHNLKGRKILDFAFYKDEIFMVSNEDLLQFKLKDIQANQTPPVLKLKQLKVQDRSVSTQEKGVFSYLDNKLEFHFNAIAHAHNGRLNYEYRLIGADYNWQKIGFEQNKVVFASLQPGKYTFEVVAINENGYKSKTLRYSFEISPPFWNTWWFYTLVIVGLSILILLLWRIQMNRIRKINQREMELISSKLTALKLQMNPHFIFNALNSIQDLILKEDTTNSYNYIVKFSSLVRMTLNYSDKEFIDLDEEIEMLELYLQLESLRFKTDFEYEIKNGVKSDIEIPCMLLQAFVENSIKHGLLHRKGQKKVQIIFKIENNSLTCTIIDNGIGIRQSKEINARKAVKHRSISIESIRKRIEILQEIYPYELGIKFIDLENEKGESEGTKVIVKLPFENV